MRTLTLLLLLAFATRVLADPRSDLKQQVEAEITAAREARAQDEKTIEELAGPVARAEFALKRVAADRERLEIRLAPGAITPERTGEILTSSIDRIRRNLRRLEDRKLPQLYRDLAAVQQRRAGVQDRVWELETPLEEEERLPEGVRAGEYTKIVAPLVSVLREHVGTLEELELAIAGLEASHERQARALEDLLSYVLGRSYWVRTQEPLGLWVGDSVASEVRDMAARYRSVPWSPPLLLLLGVLLVLAVSAAVLLRRLQRRWNYRGGPVWQGTQRAAAAFLLAAVGPVVLLLGSLVLRSIEVPSVLREPLIDLLHLLALVWYLRAVLWRIFRPGGLAVGEWNLPADSAAELLRSARIATMSAFLFRVPSDVLRAPPLALEHLPRVCFTAFLAGTALALIPLVRRRGPLVRAWAGNSVLRLRLATAASPLLMLGMVGIVVMHGLGFGLGARFLTRSLFETLAALLVLTGFYALMRRIVERVAARVRRVALEEQSGRQVAREQSEAVMQQLTRAVTVGLVTVTVVLLAGLWDLDTGIRSVLDGIEIAALGDGGPLTLWDLVGAAFWIAAGHFVVAHLSALYEFLIYPLIGSDGAGGRYVVVALARYAILLVAYSGALLSMHFSFASIGWLLAAASVGIGFGLQEIIANFISGLIILLERPIRVGDIITVGTTGGLVEKINIRATIVTNWDRQVIIVPNKKFITEELTNWTRNDEMMRRKLRVGVRYGSDVEEVLRILKEVVSSHPLVAPEPAPRLFFDAFGESSLDFEVWFFAQVREGLDALSEMRTTIHRRFREEGIEIPFPQRDLHVRSVDDEGIAAALLDRRPEQEE